MDNLEAPFVFSILKALRKKHPLINNERLYELAQIWGKVATLIMQRLHEKLFETIESIHVDLKPEMVTLQTKMEMFLVEAIIEKRTKGRHLTGITPEIERSFHTSKAGQKAINDTTLELSKVWVEKYRERWKPKTETKLKRESSPPCPKPRVPQKVSKNHFISKFFLRNYWLFDETLTIHNKLEVDGPVAKYALGGWGWLEDLYSERLEDRFSLIEGDAGTPLKKVMKSEPLNDPERHSLIGFFIVQRFRNPFVRHRIVEGSKQAVIDWVGEKEASGKEVERRVFESLFENNEFYHPIAHPLFWSKWCLLKSSKNSFVLPDTAIFIGKHRERHVMLAPLSPKVCFVCTHLSEDNTDTKDVIPASIHDQSIADKATSLLITSSQKQFLSHPDFTKPHPAAVIGAKISDLFEDIGKALTHSNIDLG